MAPQPEIREGDVIVSRKTYNTIAALFILAVSGVSASLFSMYYDNITLASEVRHLQQLYADIRKEQTDHNKESSQWIYRIIGCESGLKSCCERMKNAERRNTNGSTDINGLR